MSSDPKNYFDFTFDEFTEFTRSGYEEETSAVTLPKSWKFCAKKRLNFERSDVLIFVFSLLSCYFIFGAQAYILGHAEIVMNVTATKFHWAPYFRLGSIRPVMNKYMLHKLIYWTYNLSVVAGLPKFKIYSVFTSSYANQIKSAKACHVTLVNINAFENNSVFKHFLLLLLKGNDKYTRVLLHIEHLTTDILIPVCYVSLASEINRL